PFAGERVAACLHLEAKTACLLLLLKELGAQVAAAGSNPLSTQDDVCAALVDRQIQVFSKRGMTNREYSENLHHLVKFDPTIVIDDGADLIALIHEKYPECISRIKGACEETTSGIKRLKAMASEGVLNFPVVAVNDAKSKYLFDNRYGTGQSVIDGIMRSTNLLLAGKNLVVVGYGWCGRGVAMRAAALGSHVMVVEVDPHKAFEAIMDGYQTMSMSEATHKGDIFLTLTGNTNVIRKEHFEKMKDGVLLGNAGHFDVEINKTHLRDLSREIIPVRDNIDCYVMQDGRRINLISEGRLVNLAAGDGHPIEIMDLSFGIQLLSALYIALNHVSLNNDVLSLPIDLDREIMKIKLGSMGIEIDTMTPEQEEYMKTWKE
ncbi:MAG TPA: adenosylhomocysteinase, partial [Synergistales bacterium]|nr:adenosylhomocysteinase [Synergistales bacterium]